MSEDSMFRNPEPDNFEHETPLRAFTEFDPVGLYAVGKGFRPSVRHLPTYLDAIERREGWALVQILHADNPERQTLVFRRARADDTVVLDYSLATSAEAAARLGARDHLEQLQKSLGSSVFKEALQKAAAVPQDHMPPPTAVQPVDDPVNPKHYAGTACAEIGELLTANGYQVLKYCWRVGKKDNPCTELKKALWYLEREKELVYQEGQWVLPKPSHRVPPRRDVDNLVKSCTDFTKVVVSLLYDLNFGSQQSALNWLGTYSRLVEVIEAELTQYGTDGLCTTGLAI